MQSEKNTPFIFHCSGKTKSYDYYYFLFGFDMSVWMEVM